MTIIIGSPLTAVTRALDTQELDGTAPLQHHLQVYCLCHGMGQGLSGFWPDRWLRTRLWRRILPLFEQGLYLIEKTSAHSYIPALYCFLPLTTGQTIRCFWLQVPSRPWQMLHLVCTHRLASSELVEFAEPQLSQLQPRCEKSVGLQSRRVGALQRVLTKLACG